MLWIDCKIGEGFSLLGMDARVTSIKDSPSGWRIWIDVEDQESSKRICLMSVHVHAWMIMPVQSCDERLLITVNSAQSNRCTIGIDAPESVRVRRLKRQNRDVAATEKNHSRTEE